MQYKIEDFIKDEPIDLKYRTNNNIFWYFTVDIIECLINEKNVDSLAKKHFIDNLEEFQKQACTIVSQTIIFHLNKLFKNQSVIDDFKEFYEEFKKDFFSNKDSRIYFFTLYPELFRLLYEYFSNKLNNIILTIQIVEENKSDIMEKFKIYDLDIKEIDMGLGDIHKEGKSTTLIKIKKNKLVLKWKENCEDIFLKIYNLFIKNSNKNYKSKELYIKSIDYKEFYIQEFISQVDEYNEDKFMYNVGVFLFVSYLLGITDVHEENIIISGSDIFPIDCETIYNVNKINSNEVYDIRDSVLMTYILPLQTIKSAVLSALNSVEDQKIIVDDYKIRIDQEGIILDNTGSVMLSKQNNKPIKKFILYDKYEKIALGFENMYNVFLNNKPFFISEIKKCIKDKSNRILLKNTYEYNRMLWESYHPFCMVEEKNRYDFFYNNTELNNIEADYLFNNQIPLLNAKIDVSENFYEKFNKEDLIIQKQLIKDSVNLDKRISGKKEYLHSATETNVKKYKDYLLNNSFYYKDKLYITDVVETGTSEYMDLEIVFMPQTPYAGLSGIYLFLIEYYMKYPNKEEEDKLVNQLYYLFDQVKKDITNKYEQNGIYDGVAGVIYTVYKANEVYGFIPEIEIIRVLKKVSKNIKFDKQLDIISGSAGLLTLLVFIYKNSEIGTKLIDEISEVEKYLMGKFDRESNMWPIKLPNDDITHNIGYSHGAMGIITALYKSLEITKTKELGELLNLSLTNIYRLYCRKNNSWAVSLEEDNKYYNNWCHGLPGGLFGLAKIYKITKDKEIYNYIYNDLDKLASTIRDNNCICHGNYGNLLIGKYCSKIIKNKYFESKFDELLEEEINKICLNDFIKSNKSFMTGLTGIFYWYLKENDLTQGMDLI